MHDPALIRAALAWRSEHSRVATAARFGVSRSTISRWEAEAAVHAPAAWPSDADIAAYRAAQPRRAHERAVKNRWLWRRHTGPLIITSNGTQRRIHALAALGWRYVDVADRAGVSRGRITHLAMGLYSAVHRDTAAAIATVYDQLSMTAGPSVTTAARAAARGWAPPLAWDDDSIDDPAARPNWGRSVAHRCRASIDEVAIQRALHGDPVRLRPAELGQAVHRLTAAGHSASEIAELLHTTKRSVVRHRTADPSRRTA